MVALANPRRPHRTARPACLYTRLKLFDAAKPWLAWAHYLAFRRGEARGWTRRVRLGVQRGLVIVLSQHVEGDTIAYSEMFPVLRALDIGAERVAEVLDEMGVLVDDRRPSFEGWLERRLHGLAPGISREVEAWQRVLHDAGPRTRARDRSTCGNYLNSVRPALVVWSGRYHHLREVTRDDVLAVLAPLPGSAQHHPRRPPVAVRLLQEERHGLPQPHQPHQGR